MPNITMLDSQAVDLANIVEKNAGGGVITPNPPVQASSNAPSVVDCIVAPDNSMVTVKGKPGQTAPTNLTVTVSAVANPNAKQIQTFTVNPDPTFPTSLTFTPSAPYTP